MESHRKLEQRGRGETHDRPDGTSGVQGTWQRVTKTRADREGRVCDGFHAWLRSVDTS